MDEETIRLNAYRIWEQQGKPEGQALEHWRQAHEALQHSDNIGLQSSLEHIINEPETDLAQIEKATTSAEKKVRSRKPKT